MIPFDIVYRRPETVEEAITAWRSLPGGSLYYAGGTEIVTGARAGSYRPAALIDIKRIPECREAGRRRVDGRDSLYFGACLTLNELAEGGSFPALAASVRGVADHTVRNRITLGGNAAGRLPYREALLPFLAAGGTAHLAGPARPDSPMDGAVERRDLPVRELHLKRLVLRPGEFLLGLSMDEEAARLPFHHSRRTAGAVVDYPLVALCAIATGGMLSLALSGYLDWPAWFEAADAQAAPGGLTAPRSDHRASAAYRMELLRLALGRAWEELS